MRSRFKNCTVILNQASSGYRASKKQVTELETYFAKETFTVFTITKQDFEDTTRLIAQLSTLSSRSLLAIAGGDGTVSGIINLLILNEQLPRAAAQVTVLPLWGGNANDLAGIANGNRRENLSHIIEQGVSSAVYPLTINIREDVPNKNENIIAVCYASFGALAFTAHRLDTSKILKRIRRFKHLVLPTEIILGTTSLFLSSKFSLQFSNSKPRQLFDLTYLNGPRISKVYRARVALQKKEHLEMSVAYKHPILLGHIAKLIVDWAHPKRQSLRDFIIFSDTWMQSDGEVREIHAPAEVKIRHSQKPVHILAVNLPAVIQ